MRPLTAAQERILRVLARVGRDTTPGISRMCNARFDDWAYSKCAALARRGLVERLEKGAWGGVQWTITPAGRAYLSSLTERTKE